MEMEALAEVMRDAERKSVAAGCPAAEAATILIEAEAKLLKAIYGSRRAERQFLLDLREKGATQIARERGKSRTWVYCKRMEALNKLSDFAVPELTPAA